MAISNESLAAEEALIPELNSEVCFAFCYFTRPTDRPKLQIDYVGL